MFLKALRTFSQIAIWISNTSVHNLEMISHIIWLVFFLFPDWYECSQKAIFKLSHPEIKMHFPWTSVPVNWMLTRSDYKWAAHMCNSNVAESSSMEDLNQHHFYLFLFTSFSCICSVSVEHSNKKQTLPACSGHSCVSSAGMGNQWECFMTARERC